MSGILQLCASFLYFTLTALTTVHVMLGYNYNSQTYLKWK